MKPIRHILFVCTGNICRSPFAHVLLTERIHEEGLEGISVDSAGLLALPGNTATPLAQKVALEHGVDLSGHQAKSLSSALVARTHLLLVMEASQKEDITTRFPEAVGRCLLLRHFGRHGSRTRGIADPYGLQYESYRFCFLDIADAVLGLTAYLKTQERRYDSIRVDAHDGYMAQESPRAFEWRGTRYVIVRIIDRWYAADRDDATDVNNYFRVECKDASMHLIRYNRLFDQWAIVLHP